MVELRRAARRRRQRDARGRRGRAARHPADEEWVAPPAGWSCAEVMAAGRGAAGFSPRVAHRAGDWQAVLSLVAAGLGVALVPRLAHGAPPAGVVIVPLAGVPPRRHVFAACRAGAEAAPAVRALLGAARGRELVAAA